MEKEEKRKEILDCIKELGTATAAEISVITNVAVSSIRDIMNEEMETNQNVRCIRGKGYVWSENPTKHPEGHTDLTPYLVMIEDEAESMLTDGAVYVKKYGCTGVVGECGLFLVLRGFEYSVAGYDVFTTEHKYYDPEKHFTFKEKDREYFIQPERVISISPNKLEKCEFFLLTEVFQEIKAASASRLRFNYSQVLPKAVIDQSSAIAFLKESGWLKEHDDAVYRKGIEAAQEHKDYAYEIEARIWREAFYVVHGKTP